MPRLGLGHPVTAEEKTFRKSKTSNIKTNDDPLQGDYGGLPPCLFQLTKLNAVRLNRHAIRWIPEEVSEWQNLQILDLSDNPLLESLSAKLGLLKNLRNLQLIGCPSLNTPPEEIVNRGSDACISYLKSLSSKQVICRRTKLMFVGLGGAGKTSLLRALMNADNKSDDIGAEGITDGIDISQWEVSLPDSENVIYSTWDFAGQSVYYNTHQFFLSKRAVYLLLWSVRLGYEHAGLDFWLSSIMCHAPNAPVLIVGTHADQVVKVDLPQELLQKRYPQIVGFYTVSCTTGQGIQILRENLLETTLNQSYMGEMIPQMLLEFESQLINKRRDRTSPKDTLMWKELQDIGMNCGLHDHKELRNAVLFLHDLGSLQFFDTDFLRDRVVINPQWIVDVMACVVSVKDSPIEKGILYHKDIPRVWHKFDPSLHLWLLQLTEEFDLTFPLPQETSLNGTSTLANVVPCLLPDKEPQFDWPKLDPSSEIKEAKALYRFAYLPAGLFNRIQVRLFEFSDGEKIWKTGSLLMKNGQQALVKQEEGNILEVRVQGYRPQNIIFMIHEVIDSIVKQSFQGIQYEMLVPCPDCIAMASQLTNESLFESTLVRRAFERNVPFLQCHSDFHVTSLNSILGLLPPSSGDDHDLHLQNSLSNLIQMRVANSYGILVSYMEEDFKECTHVKLEDIMKRLSNLGLSCGDMMNMNTTERQFHALNMSLYVMLLSQRYVDNEEMVSMFEHVHYRLKKPIFLVCVGKSKDWRSSKIAMRLEDGYYVDLTANKAKNITEQLKKLEDTARAKLMLPVQSRKTFDCFISYCHKNSHEAVSKGVQAGNKSLGWSGGDPRAVQKFLAENGITCWIDTDNIGAGNLEDAIHRGLKQSKIFICFLSNDYPESQNCVMEFSFATSNLQRPIIYVHIGGEMVNAYGNSLIHMKKHKFPGAELSMVQETPNIYQQLLQIVTEELKTAPEPEGVDQNVDATKSKKTSETVFKEESELAQRNFLKQLHNFTMVSTTMKPNPRLIVIDFMHEDNKVNEVEQVDPYSYLQQQNMSSQQDSRQTIAESLMSQTRRTTTSNVTPSQSKNINSVRMSNYNQMQTLQQHVSEWSKMSMCLRVLCENERGWHEHGEPLQLPTAMVGNLVSLGAPYLHPLYQLAKNSGIELKCLHGNVGQTFLDFVAESEKAATNNRFEAYVYLHETFYEYDTERKRGDLERCKLGSGKIVWLCPEHQQKGNGRVHPMPVDDSNENTGATDNAVQEADRHLRELLLKEAPLENRLYGAKYIEAMKVHRGYLEKVKGTSQPTNKPPAVKRRQTSAVLMQEAATTQSDNSRQWRPKTGREKGTKGIIREDSTTSLASTSSTVGGNQRQSRACHLL